jgi:hypothetical protein
MAMGDAIAIAAYSHAGNGNLTQEAGPKTSSIVGNDAEAVPVDGGLALKLPTYAQ